MFGILMPERDSRQMIPKIYFLKEWVKFHNLGKYKLHTKGAQ
jgi:hypothetical protein